MAKLESNGLRTMRSFSEIMEHEASRGTIKERKEDISDEIKKLSQNLLEKLKEDTSISKSNHMIELVTHLDTDNIERLYFHVQNMRYGEYHPQQQDCYGRIDDQGLVEVFKSREPEEKKEAYSDYSKEDKKRIEEFKKIVTEGLKAIKEENNKWSEKSAMNKLFSRIKGERPKAEVRIRDYLLKLPEHLKEIKKDPTLADSIRVSPVILSEDIINSIQDTDKVPKNREH